MFLHALVGQKDCYICRPRLHLGIVWFMRFIHFRVTRRRSTVKQEEPKISKEIFMYSNCIVLHAVEWFCSGKSQRVERPPFLQSCYPVLPSRCVRAANSVSNFLAVEKQLSSEVRLKGPILKQMDGEEAVASQGLHRRTYSNFQPPKKKP